MNPKYEDQMLFWASVLSPVLYKPPEDERSDRQILIEISKQSYFDGDGNRRTFSLSTLKRKLRSYRRQGSKGLLPSLRSDKGKIRHNRDKALQRAIELKRECPPRSHFNINLILRSEGIEPIPDSTLLKHLNQHGMTLKKLGYEGKMARKRWTREHTHSLWVGDFAQGPYIIDKQGKRAKTWISAFIDVHSRFLVVGIYASNSDINALANSLLVAFERHGKPQSIYVDNAKVYRGHVLARACVDLGIELIHRTVRDPQGGGLIERFFLTAQKQFENEIVSKTKVPLDIDKLNELFNLWVDEVYHKTIHSEIKQTPESRYQSGLRIPIEPVRREIAEQYFFDQWERRVHGDFCDVTLHKTFYACDFKLRGDHILLRRPLGGTPEKLEVYDLKGRKKLGEAIKHDRSKRRLPDPRPLLEDTIDYEKVLRRIRDNNRKQASPYKPHQQSHCWTLEAFMSQICQMSGVKVTEFCDQDLEVIIQVHKQQTNLNTKKLKEVWKHCDPQSLHQLLLTLSQ